LRKVLQKYILLYEKQPFEKRLRQNITPKYYSKILRIYCRLVVLVQPFLKRLVVFWYNLFLKGWLCFGSTFSQKVGCVLVQPFLKRLVVFWFNLFLKGWLFLVQPFLKRLVVKRLQN
jgi:hypothetical protein